MHYNNDVAHYHHIKRTNWQVPLVSGRGILSKTEEETYRKKASLEIKQTMHQHNVHLNLAKYTSFTQLRLWWFTFNLTLVNLTLLILTCKHYQLEILLKPFIFGSKNKAIFRKFWLLIYKNHQASFIKPSRLRWELQMKGNLP